MAPALQLRRNPPLLCAFHALQMSLFPMAVITVFYQEQIGMDMGQIFILQGCFGLAMALFEFPSGYVADRIGYRRALIVASGLMAVGWCLYAVARTMAHVVVAELVLGVAMSLISGTDSALLYESLLESGGEDRFGAWTGRVRFFGQLGEAGAALLAGLLYAVSPRAPFAVEVAVWAVALWVALGVREPARHRPSFAGSVAQVRALVRHVAREAPALRGVMLLTITLGMASFVPVWSIQLYARAAGVPHGWLGPLWATANVIVALGSLVSHRVARAVGLERLLLGCVALVAIGYLGLGASHALWGFAFYFVLTAMRGLFGPALHHEEQRLIDSADRAGVLSLRSLTFRAMFCVLGPLVGVAMDRHGQHAVYLVLGPALAVAALGCLVAVAGRRAAAARSAR